MSKQDIEKYKIEQTVKVIIFVIGLSVAFVLALVNSSYTTHLRLLEAYLVEVL